MAGETPDPAKYFFITLYSFSYFRFKLQKHGFAQAVENGFGYSGGVR